MAINKISALSKLYTTLKNIYIVLMQLKSSKPNSKQRRCAPPPVLNREMKVDEALHTGRVCLCGALLLVWGCFFLFPFLGGRLESEGQTSSEETNGLT